MNVTILDLDSTCNYPEGMKEVCKLTTLELRMWNNEIQIGMLWDKNIDLVIETSLVIEKNNVIHKTSKYNVTVRRMTVKECTPSDLVLLCCTWKVHQKTYK